MVPTLKSSADSRKLSVSAASVCVPVDNFARFWLGPSSRRFEGFGGQNRGNLGCRPWPFGLVAAAAEDGEVVHSIGTALRVGNYVVYFGTVRGASDLIVKLHAACWAVGEPVCLGLALGVGADALPLGCAGAVRCHVLSPPTHKDM